MPSVLMEQPLKATTPAVSLSEQPETVPGPTSAVNVTVELSVVTVLPPASSIVTAGWVMKAVPPVAVAEGWVVKTTWAGAPTVTANGELVVVSPSAVSVAVRTSPVPAVLIVQPLEAATPPVVVDVQPERLPEPVVSPKVMAWVSVVTVFPPASSTLTWAGW